MHCEYAYRFELYDQGSIINAGVHFVIAPDVETALRKMKNTFPKSSISSYTKMSDEPTNIYEFNQALGKFKLNNGNVEEFKL